MLTQIITPEKIEWQDEKVDSLTLPGENGQLTILPGHADLLCTIEAGEIVVRIADKELIFFTSEGLVLIKNNQITIMADLATKAADLTQARVEEAKKAAEKAREEKVDDVEFASIEANLRRELAKEKIMDKYKRKVKNVG